MEIAQGIGAFGLAMAAAVATWCAAYGKTTGPDFLFVAGLCATLSFCSIPT